jgi:hypothetical protein
MARNERKRNVDQPARSALAGLADALASVSFSQPAEKQAGEFTVQEAAELEGKSPCIARRKLRALMEQGRATRRAVTLNGVSGYYYRLL